MKKSILIVAAVLSFGCTTAIATTALESDTQAEMQVQGWETIREKVNIYTFAGRMKTSTTAGPLQQDENERLRIYYGGKWCNVMRSNRDGYTYMFYSANNTSVHYFN